MTSIQKEPSAWKVGNRVRITKKGSHGFSVGDEVELNKYEKKHKDDHQNWQAKSESGRQFWIYESEAELITE
jgi:hypothetical protein